jgi:hypothetical protein
MRNLSQLAITLDSGALAKELAKERKPTIDP